MTGIDGAVAVVTGAASGIGAGLARELRARGAQVVVADLDAAGAAAVARDLDALAVTADVSRREDVERVAAAALERYGRVDILVNNAGVGPQAQLAAMTEDDWAWLLGVNLWSVIHGVGVFLPLLEADDRTGHIVNVASMAALDPRSPLGGYAVAKTGVLTLSEVLSQELGEKGSPVHVTVVMPGPTRTGIADSLRHRPADAAGALDSLEITPPEDLWRSAAEVAAQIAEAIEADDEYLAPHAELWPRVEARTARRRQGFESAASRRATSRD